MLMESTHTCEHKDCGENFEWYHIVAEPANSSSLYRVHKIPKDKEPVRQVLEYDENKVPSKVTAYCPHCDRLNTFRV